MNFWDLPPERRREWAAFRDGEIVLFGAGPDMEALCRAAGERIAYRDAVRPTAENGWALSGPWIDVE